MTIIHRIGQTIVKKIGENEYQINAKTEILDSLNLKFFDNIKNISIGSIGFSFKADTVQTLPQLLSYKKNITYEQSLKMIQDLGNQLISLERRGKTIAFYSLDDVIVIDDMEFIFINSDKIFEMDGNWIYINIPLSLDMAFLPPELIDKKILPIKLDYRAAYYSLSALSIYAFFHTAITEKNKDELLNPIIYTSFYWFLLRCLEKNT